MYLIILPNDYTLLAYFPLTASKTQCTALNALKFKGFVQWVLTQRSSQFPVLHPGLWTTALSLGRRQHEEMLKQGQSLFSEVCLKNRDAVKYSIWMWKTSIDADWWDGHTYIHDTYISWWMGARKGCSDSSSSQQRRCGSQQAMGNRWKRDAKAAESCMKQSKVGAMWAAHFAACLILPSVGASLQNILLPLCSSLWCR